MSVVPSIGELVTVRYTKWDGTRHWTFPAAYLGADQYGHWVGCPPDTVLDKPGTTIEPRMHFVVMFPEDDRFTPCFNEATSRDDAAQTGFAGVAIYVDITSRPEWRTENGATVVTMVDLDLDVIRQWDGIVVVDDEDEFVEHQASMSYPPDVIEHAKADCVQVLAAVQANDEPYASVGQAWLERFITSRSDSVS